MKYLLWCFFFVVFAKSNLFAQVQKKVNQPASKIENNAAMPQSKSLGSATLENVFLHPPLQARPLVYWFWMGSNFSKTGITKNLEAMKEMGIAGGIIVNLSSAVEESHVPTLNNPFPDQTYRSTAYWEAMRHAAADSRYRFTIGAKWIMDEWSKQGPAHHFAIGVGHIADKIDKLGKLIGMKVVRGLLVIKASPFLRSICVDKLYYNPDGTIKEVIPSKEGVPKISKKN